MYLRRTAEAAILTLTVMGVSLPAAHAAPAPVGLSSDETAQMVDTAAFYFQKRAQAVTVPGTQTQVSTLAVSGDDRISKRRLWELRKEMLALQQQGQQLQGVNGGYSNAEVEVTPGEMVVNGATATLEVTEDARLYYPNAPEGDPEYEEYSIPHTLTFTKGTDGGWLLDEDKVQTDLTGPGPVTQLTDPTEVVASDSDPEGQLDAGSGTAPATGTDGDKDTAIATRAANAGYNYGKMISYANKYWKNDNDDYRVYGSDCTNFISQAMLAGGWNTTAGSFSSRKDNKKWFYGTFATTTSYTWAGAENWYWFAVKHSKRTKSLNSVWKLLASDVLQADWKRDGVIDHTMIVTKRGSDGEIYLTYHTPSKHNVKLSTILAKYPNAAWYAHRT
jgi:hypothetical protein